MFEFLGFITDIRYWIKHVTFSDSIARVWIDYYAAELLEEMSIESRDVFSDMCFSMWKESKSDRIGMKIKSNDFDECADYIAHTISSFCKDKLKKMLIMAHRMSVSGYSEDSIATSIGCSLSFTKEILDNHRCIAERIFKVERENKLYFGSIKMH